MSADVTGPWLESESVTQHLRPFLDWLLRRHAEQGGHTELRILARGRGVFSAIVGPQDLDAIPGWLAPHVGYANIYFGLNPVRTDAHARHALRLSNTTVRDADIHAFSMVAIDIDPERQPRGRSATDAEKATAWEVAAQVHGFLQSLGVTPFVADSGNGYHLLVPTPPAYGEEVVQASRDVRELLRLLDRRFSTTAAHVDLTTFNPSRILKLYGTLAVKGEATPERPHRLAAIDLSHFPEDVDLHERLAEAEAVARVTPVARTERESRPEWRTWRREALAALPLDAVYGQWLTGRERSGWLECRDPWAKSGDQNPSAGISDGSGLAERASFHSFRTGDTYTVFDFLVRQGEAVDFPEASAKIAELSGVPQPSTRSLVDRFRAAWASATSDDQRNRLIRSTLTAAAKLPAIEQQQALDVVRQHSGLSLQVLRRSLREARHSEPAPAEPSLSERPVIEVSLHQDTVAETFTRLLDGLAPAQRFFRYEDELVYVHDGRGPQRVAERAIAGLVSAHVELRFAHLSDGEVRSLRYDVLPGDFARAFVHSPLTLSALPKLSLYTRSPLFDTAWRFIGEPGLHEPSGAYYDGPSVPLLTGVAHLKRALAGFHFKSPIDEVNVLGAALTALTMPHWGRGHPFLAINGNKPGVGKSTLARLLGVLAEGREPSSISWVPDESEFEKQLATRVEAGDRVVVIDNAKTNKPIESAILERCITDTRLNFRRLGSNTSISRPQNDMLFCLTMNLTQMGPDLRRRALPVNLELDQRPRDTHYALPDVIAWTIEHRLPLLGELAGMVQRWVDAGRPMPERPARHSTSQLWAATIDAILRHAGIEGFLANFEATEHAFDPRYELMQEIAAAYHDQPPAAATAWARWLEPLLADRFHDRAGRPRSERARATIVGALFREYLDTPIDVGEQRWAVVREHPDGPTRSPIYRFAPVNG